MVPERSLGSAQLVVKSSVGRMLGWMMDGWVWTAVLGDSGGVGMTLRCWKTMGPFGADHPRPPTFWGVLKEKFRLFVPGCVTQTASDSFVSAGFIKASTRRMSRSQGDDTADVDTSLTDTSHHITAGYTAVLWSGVEPRIRLH